MEKEIIDTVPVKTMTIDSFLKGKKPINFIRMDIEGFECEVIDGMMNTLKTQKSDISIMVEFHPELYNEGRNFVKRLKKLGELGFKVKYIVSAEKVYYKIISERGYSPIKIAKSKFFSRGLYKDIEMKDLIDFINYEKKIVRAGFFVRNALL